MPKMICPVSSSAWLSVIMCPIPLDAPISSATMTYVHAQPSTSRSDSAMSGALDGSSTRRTTPAAPAPRVEHAHAATKTSKNATPKPTRTPGETGTRGFSIVPRDRWSLEKARVDDCVRVGNALDDPELEQELGRVLAERLDLAREELLVGLAVLPAQIGLRLLELLARLLHGSAHDLEALLRLVLDHVQRVEVAVHHRLHKLRTLLDELRRAAERVHDHRIVERRRDDLPRVRLLAHARQIRL